MLAVLLPACIGTTLDFVMILFCCAAYECRQPGGSSHNLLNDKPVLTVSLNGGVVVLEQAVACCLALSLVQGNAYSPATLKEQSILRKVSEE